MSTNIKLHLKSMFRCFSSLETNLTGSLPLYKMSLNCNFRLYTVFRCFRMNFFFHNCHKIYTAVLLLYGGLRHCDDIIPQCISSENQRQDDVLLILTKHSNLENLVLRLCISEFADFVKPRLTEADVHQDQRHILFIRNQ